MILYPLRLEGCTYNNIKIVRRIDSCKPNHSQHKPLRLSHVISCNFSADTMSPS